MAAEKALAARHGRAMPVPTTLFEKKRKRDSCAFFFEIKNMKEKTGGNMKTRRTCKEKLLAVLLALAMLLPAVPNLGVVDTAEAASAYTLHEANASGGDGDAYRFKSGKFMQIFVVRYNSGMKKEEAYLQKLSR